MILVGSGHVHISMVSLLVMMVLDDPRHVPISMLHPYRVFCKLAVLWIGMLYSLHVYSSPESVPNFGQIWAIVGRVYTMLG